MEERRNQNRISALCEQKTHSHKRFSIWAILKFALRGAPFSWKYISTPWKSVQPPNFPILFTVLSGVLFIIPPLEMSISIAVRQEGFELGGLVSTYLLQGAFGVLILATLNFVLALWFAFMLKIFGFFSKKKLECVSGAQRISYFSTVFQPILFLTLALDVLLDGYFNYAGWFMSTSVAIMVFAGIVRLLAVFQSMRREAGGSVWAGLLAIILCFDVWFIFGMIYDYLGVIVARTCFAILRLF